MDKPKQPEDARTVSMRRFCQQPDRHQPALVCGYPLPCPHHTAVIDVSGEQPRVEIPEHGAAAAHNAGKLSQVARALHESPRERAPGYDYHYSPDEQTVIIEHSGVPCVVMSAEVFEWLRSLPPIRL